MGELHRLFEREPFRRMEEARRVELERAFVERDVPARQALYRTGGPPPGVWVVSSGFVKLTRGSPAGQELMMGLAGPGDLLGPCCDPLEPRPATCSAIALTPVHALYVSQPAWQSLTTRDPAAAQPLLAALLATRRGCADLATQLAFCSVEARLAQLLTTLARWSTTRTPPIVLPSILTQAEMADALGTAREVVTRSLARLEERGVIERRGRKVVLMDPEALTAE